MKTNWVKGIRLGFCALALAGLGTGLTGCADEYVGYPGYRGGYYASYPAYRPYYGGYGYYGYPPYRSYGPYYGAPYYGGGYYGGGTVVISGNRNYAYRNNYRRTQRRDQRTRSRNVTRPAVKKSTPAHYDNDDERRYYTPR